MAQDNQPEILSTFEMKILIEPADIDQLGHVNNVRYVRWVQDAAVAHWRARAPAAEQERLFWVVLRHEIDYLQPAFLSEELTVRTWVGQATRLKFERITEFTRARDGLQIAKARTIWCPIDATTAKPVEVSAEIRSLFSVAS